MELNNIDLSIFQNAIVIGTTAPVLCLVLPNAVAHLIDMLTDHLRDMGAFKRWYCRIMDFIVFETPEEPTEIEARDSHTLNLCKGQVL